MKKLLATALALLLTVFFGTALAQDLGDAINEASHEVEVIIPEVLFVQIIGTDPMVTFDLTVDVDAYLTAADDATAIGSTSSTMTDVEVWANGGWALQVSAVEFTDAGSLLVANIEVTPRSGDAHESVDTPLTSFRLGTVAATIATGTATGGWASVGISGDDYALYVDGSEAEGTHTTTVTYTIINN